MKTLIPQRSGGSDHYQTPPSALEPLLQFIPKSWIIWEPTADQRLLANTLESNGYKTIATGIETGHDFLKCDPPQCDCIITNPPYSIKNRFIKRCYELNKPFALLMPLTALEGIERQTLYKRHGIELLIPHRRTNYIVPEGQHESGAWFMSAWFCKGILPQPIIFTIPEGKVEETGRFSK